jgi:15-cis-phytoene synthase
VNTLALALATEPAEAVLARHSRSFTLASRLLDAPQRARVATLYAWCRRADDAIDCGTEEQLPTRLAALRAELDSIYSGREQTLPLLSSLQRVLFEANVPAAYPGALLQGMEMDVERTPYGTLGELHGYCFRVAGVVGLMLCHVLGVSSDRALRHAAHLGIAMQLTNVCRDVVEDWHRGRLYVPDALIELPGEPLRSRLGGPMPENASTALAAAVRRLLDEADALYRSADAGMGYLPLRARVAVRVARHVYAEIGAELRARGCDVFAGRTVVSARRKAALVLKSLFGTLRELPRALEFRARPVSTSLKFPEDVLP